MSKYRQKIIPEVKIQTCRNLRRYVRDYYAANVQGKTVVNEDIGLTIYFGSDGKAELAHGRAMYASKAALVQCLPTLLKVAERGRIRMRRTCLDMQTSTRKCALTEK